MDSRCYSCDAVTCENCPAYDESDDVGLAFFIKVFKIAEMKKLVKVSSPEKLPQADDRRSPLLYQVFSFVSAKPKADRRNVWACEMFSPAFFRAHFAAPLGRVAPIG